MKSPTKNQHESVAAYRLDIERVLDVFDTSSEGLSYKRAAHRLEKYGPNELERVNQTPKLFSFLRQFKDPMIILLLVSAGISLYLKDVRTAVILIIITFVNASIGFYQENKAENIMKSLESLVVARATVRREGQQVEVRSSELVPGDIAYIEEGASVPADLRLIEENELSTNDFALTGESNPSRKFLHKISGSVGVGDRHNLVYMGTTVATGQGYGIVIASGMRTELGRIASLSQETHTDKSPLQKEMAHLARRITQGTLILGVILASIVLRTHGSLHDAFIFAIGIASAMIPQGLPAEVNTALAQAAGKLARSRALVKKLSAVETLGSTSVILTDKTGTLTKNEMTVEQILIGKTPYWVSGSGYETNGTILNAAKKPLAAKDVHGLELFLTTGVFASNARINQPDSEHHDWYCLGDPTEGALIVLARKGRIDDAELARESPELREFTFDSARKRMSSIRHYQGKTMLFSKGAPESMLERCTHILLDGKVQKLTDATREFLLGRNETMAQAAMRNLAYAYRELPSGTDLKKLDHETAETDMIFLGIASMIDPPREEIPAAAIAALAAHIPVSIVTGDNALTAKAIAIKAGLANTPDELVIVEGEELRGLSDNDIITLVEKGRVIFSRVAPEDKLRIVELAKSDHQVVAVTGDGINDAPALKRADIGVAMGRTGTDVAKQSAAIVLLDDSFHTLVSAIQQGRVIYQNIQKATLACLTSNVGELAAVLISLLASSIWHIPLAITAVEILAVDLMAELFPIAALGWDPPTRDVMHEKPRDPKHHILHWQSILDLGWSGLLMGSLAYLNFLFFFERHGISPQHISAHSTLYMQATTLTYVTICLTQFANILLRRIGPRTWVFTSYLWSNKQLLSAFGMSLTGILLLVYLPPVQHYMGMHGIAAVDWLYALTAAGIYLIIRQLFKLAAPLPKV